MHEKSLRQACAIPYWYRNGHLEFCLITSSKGRWSFPKGFIEPGETLREAALKEAFEEAGLHGRIKGKSLGCYDLNKDGYHITVTAVLMKVARCDQRWIEEDRRKRQWVRAKDADALIVRREQRKLLAVALKRV